MATTKGGAHHAPRHTKSPRQRAQEQLDVATRHVTRLEGKDARDWVNRTQVGYDAHHAEAHPIVVTLPGTDNDRAPSHRKPAVPKAAVLAERIRAGETLEQVAESLERTPGSIAPRLVRAGFNSRTGQPQNHRDGDGLLIPARPSDFPAWFDDALCAQTDPESFFPEKGGSTAEAKRVCAVCPVRVKCLQYALDNHERFGVWGGLSEQERRRVARAAS